MRRIMMVLCSLVLLLLACQCTALADGYWDRVNAFINDSRWRNGAPWNGSTTPKSNKKTGWECYSCYAYAQDFFTEVWGSHGKSTFRQFEEFSDPNQIRNGDIVFLQNSSSTHYYVVLERYSDGRLRTAEGNVSWYENNVLVDVRVVIADNGYTVSNPGKSVKPFVCGWHMPLDDFPPPKPVLTVNYIDDLQATILSWNATQNTDFYSIRFYDTSGNLIYMRDDYTKTAFAALLPAGTFQAEVCSVRRGVWVTESDRVNFTISAASPTHTPELEQYDTLNGKLYKLYSFDGTWLEAKALVEAEGGRLAIIDSQAKQDCVFEMVNDFGQIAYLGAEGYSHYYWVWSNGSKVEGYTNWDNNKPDNWQGMENCLIMYPSNGSWDDYPNKASTAKGYVAEFDAVSLSVETIEPFWLGGADTLQDNLQVFVTFPEGTSVLLLGGYDLSTTEGDGVITANVSYAGLTASCQMSTKMPEADFILPEGLTVIEADAFNGLAMTSVMCPEGLEEIGARAFADCPNLRNIYISESVTAIDSAAFEGCDDLTIWGRAGSVAQTFANNRGFTFKEYID